VTQRPGGSGHVPRPPLNRYDIEKLPGRAGHPPRISPSARPGAFSFARRGDPSGAAARPSGTGSGTNAARRPRAALLLLQPLAQFGVHTGE